MKEEEEVKSKGTFQEDMEKHYRKRGESSPKSVKKNNNIETENGTEISAEIEFILVSGRIPVVPSALWK